MTVMGSTFTPLSLVVLVYFLFVPFVKCRPKDPHLILPKCTHLKTGIGQSNALLIDGRTCCMCYKGSFLSEYCKEDEVNSTICLPCPHTEKGQSYIHFEPHNLRKCYDDFPACLGQKTLIAGLSTERPECRCPDGEVEVDKYRCEKWPKDPTVTTDQSTTTGISQNMEVGMKLNTIAIRNTEGHTTFRNDIDVKTKPNVHAAEIKTLERHITMMFGQTTQAYESSQGEHGQITLTTDFRTTEFQNWGTVGVVGGVIILLVLIALLLGKTHRRSSDVDGEKTAPTVVNSNVLYNKIITNTTTTNINYPCTRQDKPCLNKTDEKRDTGGDAKKSMEEIHKKPVQVEGAGEDSALLEEGGHCDDMGKTDGARQMDEDVGEYVDYIYETPSHGGKAAPDQ